MEWSPRPGASGFRVPGNGNWGASGDPPQLRLQSRKTPVSELQVPAWKRVGISGCALGLGSPGSLSAPRAAFRFRGGGRGARGFVEVLLEAGEIVAAREEGGVLGPRSERAGGLGGGSEGLRGKGHVCGGSCRAAGSFLTPSRSNDRCLFGSFYYLGAESGQDWTGSVGRLTQLFLMGWSSSDTFRVCSRRS